MDYYTARRIKIFKAVIENSTRNIEAPDYLTLTGLIVNC